jgi:hypothetical protein
VASGQDGDAGWEGEQPGSYGWEGKREKQALVPSWNGNPNPRIGWGCVLG